MASVEPAGDQAQSAKAAELSAIRSQPDMWAQKSVYLKADGSPERPRPVEGHTSMQAIRVERQIGGRTLTIETGTYAKLADGVGDRAVRRHGRLRRRRPRQPARGDRLLPAPGRLPRAPRRRRQVPRRVHEARGPAHHQGNPHRPPDRPPAAPAVPQGVHGRGADPPERARRRPGERPGHARRHRRVAPRSRISDIPFITPDRARPRRPDRRQVRRSTRRIEQIEYSDLDLVVAGTEALRQHDRGRRPRGDRGRRSPTRSSSATRRSSRSSA